MVTGEYLLEQHKLISHFWDPIGPQDQEER